tara:strand:+ start:236 stop:1282 length:1047 start_codon:yes stop_codon:yes gene_type:complete
MTKLLYFGSVPAPYQNEFWEECEKSINVLRIYLYSKQSGHDWKIKKTNNQRILEHNILYLPGLLKLCKQIYLFKPDSILIGGYKLKYVIPIIALSYLIRVEIIFWLEKPLPGSTINYFLRSFYQRLILKLGKRIFAIGKDAASYYSQLHRNVIDLPYSLDCEKFIEKDLTNNIDNPLKFLFIGQYIHRKGIQEAIQAFKSVNHKDITFDLIGGGPLNKNINETIDDDLRIRNLGYIENIKFPKLMKDYDVFIFPSRHDGWALTLVEAMAAGHYILGTKNTSSFNQYIKDETQGRAITQSIGNIKDSILWCIDNASIVRNGGLRNQEYIKTTLSNSRNAANYLQDLILK